MEIIKPDTTVIELLKMIIAQNARIIEINLQLVTILNTPIMLVNEQRVG
jgi:hypothetical protein